LFHTDCSQKSNRQEIFLQAPYQFQRRQNLFLQNDLSKHNFQKLHRLERLGAERDSGGGEGGAELSGEGWSAADAGRVPNAPAAAGLALVAGFCNVFDENLTTSLTENADELSSADAKAAALNDATRVDGAASKDVYADAYDTLTKMLSQFTEGAYASKVDEADENSWVAELQAQSRLRVTTAENAVATEITGRTARPT
jgi:hypothetical protein